MYGAAYVALYREASCKVRNELDIITFPRSQPSYDSTVEVVNNLETVRLHRIVIDDMDDNDLSEGDVHDRPWSRMIGTSIEPHVRAFVRHHDGKDRGIGRIWGTGPAIRSLSSKEMKRVSAKKRTGPNYHEGRSHQVCSPGLWMPSLDGRARGSLFIYSNCRPCQSGS